MGRAQSISEEQWIEWRERNRKADRQQYIEHVIMLLDTHETMNDPEIVKILKKHKFLKCDYGYACGRAWIEIDGKVIAQTSGDDCRLLDEDVGRIIDCVWNGVANDI